MTRFVGGLVAGGASVGVGSTGGRGQEHRDGDHQPPGGGTPGLLADPCLGLLAADGACLSGGGSVSGKQQLHRGVGEYRGADLDLDVVEAGVEQQIAVCAGDAGVRDGVGAGVHDAAGQVGLVGVDHHGLPVLAEQHDSATGGKDPAGFGQGGGRLGQDVVHLVRPVPVGLPVAQRQVGGVGGAYVDVGKAAAGGGQHGRVEVHTDGAGAVLGEFDDGAAGAAADVDHRRVREQPPQL